MSQVHIYIRNKEGGAGGGGLVGAHVPAVSQHHGCIALAC